MLDAFARGFASMVADIRHKVLEEGWFGKAVTPRAQTITIGSTADKSPGEQLGWWRRDERPEPSPGQDRDAAAKEPKSPERGIDL